MIQQTTAKAGLEVGVTKGESRYSARRIVIIITLIVSLIGAVIIGNNMRQASVQESTEMDMVKKAAIDSVSKRFASNQELEYKEFKVADISIENPSPADSANHIKKKGIINIVFVGRAVRNNGKELPWLDASSSRYFFVKENGEIIIK